MHQFAASLACEIKSRARLGYAFFLFIAVLFAFAQPSIDAQVPADNGKDTRAVWVAAHEGIVKLDPAAYAALLTVADSEKTSRLAIDSRNLTLWALAKGTLTKYDFTGAPLLKTALPGSGDDDAADTRNAVLAVNQADGVVWIGISKKLLRYDTAGNPLGAISLSAKIASISFDEAGGRVWIATEKSAGAYDANGAFLGALALGKNPKVRALAFDNSAGRLWVAAGENLAAYTADGVFVAAAECEEVDALYADPAGGIWAIAHDRLYHYSKSAWLLYKSDEESDGGIGVFSVDPFDRSLWLTDKKDFYHLNADGQTLYTAPLSSKAHAIAVYADTIPPVLTITAPAPASYTNNNRPVITLAYSDIGSGADPLTIAVTANGAQLAVTCAADAKRADCTPNAPMADGAHAIAATVKDRAGNISNTVKTSFTVDTVPPTIALAAPVNGAVTNNPSLSIAGSVNEPATLTFTHRAVANGAPVVNGGTIAVAASNTFSHGPIALAEGSNDFGFTATDRAGNRAQATATVTLDTVPPPAIALMNVSVSFPVGGIVTVLGLPGSAEAGSTITIVNNTTGIVTLVPAGAAGGFTAAVNAGWWDVLTLTATDAAGNTGPPVTVQVVMPPPPAPLGVTATAGDAAATIDWQPTPTTDSYNLYYSTAGVVTTADAKMVNVIPPFVHTGLNNGTTYSYAVTAVNSGGESPLSAQVLARPLPPIPVAPSGVTATAGNGEVGIAWNAVAGADSYTIYYSSAPGVTKASAAIANAASPYLHTGLTNGSAYYYAVAAVNLGGEGPLSAEASATPIQPGPALPPDPAKVAPPNDLTKPTDIAESMAFLYTGANAIQQGVASGTIEARRVAVIRGKVITRDGAPLPGVTITIKDHPEFGSTLSRADGMFDIALNGGGVMVVKYDMVGWLPAQRSVTAQWVDMVSVDDVALIQLDPQVSTVDLANATAIQVAQGSVQTDVDGSRQATMLFQPGTTATMTMPDGTTQPLTTLNVRATEYTVGPNGPAAMPGELPSYTGYTYAVELSVDEALAAGAKGVQFSQMVYTYVDNFINMPLGSIVPNGVYDKQKAAWAGADDGIIISILSINAAGLAEVDVTGTGLAATAAQLTTLNMTDVERQKLAQLYQPGKSLWRMPVRHFSTYDYNFPKVCAVVGGCNPPNAAPPSTNPPKEGGPCKGGSIIECNNQVLGERLDLAGTDFTLNYRTSRTAGSKSSHMINIPLTKTLTPGVSIQGVVLTVEVAGQKFTKTFHPASDLTYTYVWDGNDGYGRPIQGVQPVKISISYVYNFIYGVLSYWNGTRTVSAWMGIMGGNSSGTGGVIFRVPMPLTTIYHTMIGSYDFKPAGLGGWSISPQHAYDPVRGILNKGDGTMESVGDFNKVISTVVSRNFENTSSLSVVQSFTFGPDGSLYYSDGNRIIRIKPDNTASVIAGGNGYGYTGDGGPATLAKMGGPIPDIAVDSDGAVYFVNQDFGVIRKVAPDGIISTVAGIGRGLWMFDNPPKKDGIQATLEQMNPFEIEIGPDKYLYLIDHRTDPYYIRKIGPDGIISTLPIPSGWGTDAGMGVPTGMTFDKAGNLYFADYSAQRIKRFTPRGQVEKIAGNGCLRGAWGFCYSSYSGDGGSALQAYLNPLYLAIGPDGTIYSSEVYNYRIRGINQEGVINTVFGAGNIWSGHWRNGYLTPDAVSPDGTPAADVVTSFTKIAIGPDGNLYYYDAPASAIRKVNFGRKRFEPGDSLIPSNDGGELYVFTGGRHIRTLDGRTGAVKYELAYNAKGLLVRVTDAYGNVTTVERDAQGNPLAIVSPYGQRTALTLDANGYLASAADPAGSVHAYTYSADGLMASYLDPNAGLHAFSYDAYGLLLRDTNPAGGFWNITRVEGTQGPVITMTTAEGRNHVYTAYDDSLRQKVMLVQNPDGTASTSTESPNGATTVTQSDGTVSTVKLGPDSRWKMRAPVIEKATVATPGGVVSTTTGTRSVTLAVPGDVLSLNTQTDTTAVNGKTYTTVYDNTLKKVTATSPAGRQNIALLDANGKVTKSQTPGLADVNYAYDARGRLTGIATGLAPDTRSTSLAYGIDGNVASVIDAMGRVTSYAYDAAGRMTSVTLPDGSMAFYTYDANGNITSITPPGRPMHGMAYNAVDLETLYNPPVAPGAGITTYAYNLDKQLTLITRPDGGTISYRYDGGGKLANVGFGSGNIGYVYNPTTGKLASIASSWGENLAYAYDGFLRTIETWSGAVNGVVTKSYNNDFREAGISVNGGAPIAMGYDLDGLLTSAGTLTITRTAQQGFVSGTALGAVSTAFTYDAYGQVSSSAAKYGVATLYSAQYTRDKLDRITRKVETVNGVAKTYDYAYDIAGRLSQVTENGVIAATYTYDQNGNRASRITPNTAEYGTYDAQDRMTSYGNATYSYSANGELLSKTNPAGTTTYGYDSFGNLLSVTLPDGALIEYVIDGKHRRVGKKINGVLVQGLLYGNQLNPVAELDGNGNMVATFIYGIKANVPDYVVKNNATYRIVTDHLGSPVMVVDIASGAVAEQITYDEFGNVLSDTNPGFLPFGFAGGLYEPRTGLVRFGFRDYAPATGRWSAKDPIRFAGGDFNLYGYVMNDPVNFIDVNGLVEIQLGPDIPADKMPGKAGEVANEINKAKKITVSPKTPGTMTISPLIPKNVEDIPNPNKWGVWIEYECSLDDFIKYITGQ